MIEQIAAHPNATATWGCWGLRGAPSIRSWSRPTTTARPRSRVLVIPGGLPCAEERAPLPPASPPPKTSSPVNADDYLPMTTKREASENRYVIRYVTPSGSRVPEVNKNLRQRLLWIRRTAHRSMGGPGAEENFRIIDERTPFPACRDKLQGAHGTPVRRVAGPRRKPRPRSGAKKQRRGVMVFKYTPLHRDLHRSDDTPFEQKVVNGTIPREWI